MLKIKSFLGFRVCFLKRSLKNEASQKAAIHYIRQLMWKGLRGWLSYLLRKKQREDNRRRLVEAITRTADKNLLTDAMDMWKLHREESITYRLNLKEFMTENSLKRIFLSWKNYSSSRKQEASIIANHNVKRITKTRRAYFDKSFPLVFSN